MMLRRSLRRGRVNRDGSLHMDSATAKNEIIGGMDNSGYVHIVGSNRYT